MPPRSRKPRTVVIDGIARHVVHSDTRVWVEREPSGRHVVHLGKLLDTQTPGRWLDEPRPCSRCKQPSWTATPLGRAVHDTCEGWLNVMPDDIYAQVVFGVAADLGAQILSTTSTPRESRRAA